MRSHSCHPKHRNSRKGWKGKGGHVYKQADFFLPSPSYNVVPVRPPRQTSKNYASKDGASAARARCQARVQWQRRFVAALRDAAAVHRCDMFEDAAAAAARVAWLPPVLTSCPPAVLQRLCP